jgi:hypothetical protein
LPECADDDPGFRFCGGGEAHECDADNVRAPVVEQCEAICRDGACDENADACPGDSLLFDCSGDCSDLNCTVQNDTDCVLSAFNVGGRLSDVGDSLFVRTSSYGDLCEGDCPGSFRGLSIGYSDHRIRFTVEPPWQLLDGVECSEPAGNCLIVEGSIGTQPIWILTDDPDAGPRNVFAEAVDEEAICP